MSSIFCVTILVALAAVFVSGQEGELKVEVLHAMAKCDRKTKKHDLVTMHYTGFLENGTQFDSRLVLFFKFQ